MFHVLLKMEHLSKWQTTEIRRTWKKYWYWYYSLFNYLFLWSTCRILSCFSEQPFGKNLTETSLGTRIRIENRHNYIVILQVIQKVRSPSVQSRKSSRRPLVPPANWEEESEERLEILPAGRPSVQASGGQISVEVLTSHLPHC